MEIWGGGPGFEEKNFKMNNIHEKKTHAFLSKSLAQQLLVVVNTEDHGLYLFDFEITIKYYRRIISKMAPIEHYDDHYNLFPFSRDFYWNAESIVIC